MAIVKRLVKGSALTHAELDNNFTELQGLIPAVVDNSYEALAYSASLSVAYNALRPYKAIGALTGNIAITNIGTDNVSSGIYKVTQDATGGRTVTINGTVIPINPAANSSTLIGWNYDGTVYDFDTNFYNASTAIANSKVTGITVTGTTSKTITLTFGDGSTIQANFTDLTAVLTPLSAPVMSTPTVVSSTALTPTWTNVANESNYQLERSVDNVNWTTIASPVTDTTSFADTGRTASTLYYYRIKAIGNGTVYSDSPYSNVVSATTSSAGEYSGTVLQTTKINFTDVANDTAGWNNMHLVSGESRQSTLTNSAGTATGFNALVPQFYPNYVVNMAQTWMMPSAITGDTENALYPVSVRNIGGLAGNSIVPTTSFGVFILNLDAAKRYNIKVLATTSNTSLTVQGDVVNGTGTTQTGSRGAGKYVSFAWNNLQPSNYTISNVQSTAVSEQGGTAVAVTSLNTNKIGVTFATTATGDVIIIGVIIEEVVA